jgi:hypothetical protein
VDEEWSVLKEKARGPRFEARGRKKPDREIEERDKKKKAKG